jgi:hypothetical protein
MALYNYVKPLWQHGPFAVHDAPDEVVRCIEASVERVPCVSDQDANAERLIHVADQPEHGIWIAWVQCEVALQVDAVDFSYRRAKFLHAIAGTRDVMNGDVLSHEIAVEVFRRSYGKRISQGISAQQSLIEQLEHESGSEAARSLFIDIAQIERAALGEPEPGTLPQPDAPSNGSGAETPTSLNTLLRFKSPNPVEAPTRREREPAIKLAATTLEETALELDTPLCEAPSASALPARAEVQAAAPDAPVRPNWSVTALAAAALVMIGVSGGFFVGNLQTVAAAPSAPSVSAAPTVEDVRAQLAGYEERIVGYERIVQVLEARLATREAGASAAASPASPAPSMRPDARPVSAAYGDRGADHHAQVDAPLPATRPTR